MHQIVKKNLKIIFNWFFDGYAFLVIKNQEKSALLPFDWKIFYLYALFRTDVT